MFRKLSIQVYAYKSVGRVQHASNIYLGSDIYKYSYIHMENGVHFTNLPSGHIVIIKAIFSKIEFIEKKMRKITNF